MNSAISVLSIIGSLIVLYFYTVFFSPVTIGFIVVVAVVCAVLAWDRQRNPFVWFFWGVAVSMIALIVLWATTRNTPSRSQIGTQTKLCPYCRSSIPIDATVCRYCARDVNIEKSH